MRLSLCVVVFLTSSRPLLLQARFLAYRLCGNGWGWGSLDKPVQASNVNIMIEGAGVIGGLDQPEKAEHKKTNTCM